MKPILFLAFFILSVASYGQSDERISTIDFVQVLNGSKAEAIYYYQNNWKIMREWAVDRKLIHSYELLETEPTEESPYTLILITTYSNTEQYAQREDNFAKLIEEKGSLKLLNDKKPGDFRKIINYNEGVKHLN